MGIFFVYPQDIHFGEKFSREWSDSGEEPVKEGVLQGPKGLAGQLMRKHDSEAGRRAVRSRMQRVCKCHGEPLMRRADNRRSAVHGLIFHSARFEDSEDFTYPFVFPDSMRVESTERRIPGT